MNESESVFDALMQTIENRRDSPSPRSYTRTLLDGGAAAIGAKILEEASEVIEAASAETSADGQAQLVHEAADLIYHLFVMLAYRHVTLTNIADELRRRFGTSGLDEKASRAN
jgi:phosphoribosyl-ATP pyrophosphohydrolase